MRKICGGDRRALALSQFLVLSAVHLRQDARGQRICLAGRLEHGRGGGAQDMGGVVGLVGHSLQLWLLFTIESCELLELSDLALQLLQLAQKHSCVARLLRRNHGQDGLRLRSLDALL
jgi:hypothetical protein